jgi:alpha-glucosidase (family GH31 glycosyl hydrolase)
MKRLLALVIAVYSLAGGLSAAETSDNVAYKDGHVRFTLISPRSVRLEYSPDGKFINGKTLLAVDREYAPVTYKVKSTGKFVEIRTDLITVRYRKDSGTFTSENLSITASKSNPFQFSWKPGMEQKENLKGTRHGYDAVKGRTVMYGRDEGKTVELDDGILARDGWTLIDDSRGPVFVKGEKCQLHPITEEWIENRPENGSQDWYFLSYGHDYQSALKDFTSFSGPIPLLPRYAYGNWHSWYWLYSDGEFREMIDNYRKYGIPVDVLCIDMDRHINGWYGWDWNRDLFPDPEKMFADFHADHLKLTANMHIDYLYGNESSFAPMKNDLGPELAPGDTITLNLSNRKVAGSFFRREIDKMYGLGWDFLWDDNGAYVSPAEFPSIDMNLWRGHLFFEDNAARGKRPLYLGRYGGLGGHRYPVGFSGDTFATWESLEFQTEYNTSSANVCFLWTHDLGGFQNEWWDPEKPFAQTAKYDTELLLRWLQFGALTPAMRNQTAKQISICKYPWEQPREYFEPIREAVRFHYALNPYIYSMSRKAYETGISVCRPLYYEWPESEEAYSRKNEYMFGDNIFVAPITAPKGESRLSHLRFWLPEGSWYEWATGTMLEGGKGYERAYALNEYPMFVKAGAIIPMYDGTQTNLDGCDEAITVVIAPGEGDSRFSLYEDDGVDPDYAHNFATTEITSSRHGNIHKIVIGVRKGSYRNMPSDRSFRLKLLSAACPKSVTVNGKDVNWSFDGMDIAVLVDVPQTRCDAEKVVEIEYSENTAALDGLKGAAKRSYEAIYDLKRNHEDITYFFPDYMARVYTVRESLYYHPERMDELVDGFWKDYNSVIDRLSAIPLKPAYINRYKSFFE